MCHFVCEKGKEKYNYAVITFGCLYIELILQHKTCGSNRI